MKLTIDVVFHCGTEREAASLEEVLSPDNKAIPKDQELTSQRQGTVLSYRISSERATGCISSALGLLSDAKLFQDVWGATT